MRRTMVGIVALLLFGAGVGMVIPVNVGAATEVPVRFGMDAYSVNQQTNVGVKPDYGTLWVGPWTLKHGWGGPNSQLDSLSAAGVTPVIHYYYWGDDISPTCVENGCWSSLHDAWKDKAGWQTLAQQLVDNLNARMGGKPVVILLETEFNKGGIENHEAFDGYLAEKADFLHQHYPNAQVVIPFGNWNSAAWGNFDRAVAASDMVGLQGMRGSTRDSATSYANLYESTLSGVRTAKSLFASPVLIHDIAISSYPEPDYLEPQAQSLQKFFTGLPDLKAAGVTGIIYRSWQDSPNMDLANYYGAAERHWGFAFAYSGDHKPAAKVWIDGVTAERATEAPDTTGSFSATFEVPSGVNEWWVETAVSSSNAIAKVEVTINGGSWISLPATDWGTWAKSVYAATGSEVVFRATDTSGNTASSQTYKWLQASDPALSASFAVPSGVNEWWVEVAVDASNPLSKVEARINGGSWIGLAATDWGTWAKSVYAPTGSSVVFRATDTYAQAVTSQTYSWLTTSEPSPSPSETSEPSPSPSPSETSEPSPSPSPSETSEPSPSPSPAPEPAFEATFTPEKHPNRHFVRVAVDANQGIAKVQASVDGGKWVTLEKEDADSWQKKLNVPKDGTVRFRAVSDSGEIATSGTIRWG